MQQKQKRTRMGAFFVLEASPRFELGIEVLQTFALPLGYDAAFDCLNIIAEVFRFVKPFSKVF